MNKDLYEILGLSKGASDNEIKKSYKRLALKYHPDRQGGKSESEKKEAEEKFKEIGFAYSILSDPEKKQRYDNFGITDDQQSTGTDFDPTDLFARFMHGFGGFGGGDPFADFFGRGKRQQNRGPEKGQSIQMNIPVGIEEILKGVNRDIEYDIFVRCPKCNGTGGEGVQTCPHCHGTGMISEVQRGPYGIMQNMHPCPYCNGTGEIIKNKCSECKGEGLKKKTVKVNVHIPAGFENGYQEYIQGKGYESKNKNGQNGDLLLIFVYQIDNSKYIIQGNNIYEKIEVPYYDCILGNSIERTLPTGEKIKITIPPYSKDGNLINSGKRFGKLTYNFVIVSKLPTYIRESEKKLLEQIRKENS